jgi:hypothetical protein
MECVVLRFLTRGKDANISTINAQTTGEITGFHSGQYEDNCLLGHCTV